MSAGEPAGTDLTQQELDTFIRLARRVMRADEKTLRAVQAQKINVVPANFYSEIPTLEEIENSFEFKFPEGPYAPRTIFNRAEILKFLGELDSYAEEFNPPVDGEAENPREYYWRNPAFSFSDAMAYYCMLRLLKPKHVLEVGSGFSTLVALSALSRNGTGTVSCIEPYPMPWLERLGSVSLHRSPAQTFEADFFNAQLADGDVLFIDSTHTVKAGSDCLHLYLRILPELNAKLTVHAHDIYLPFPLPRSQFDRHIYWTEQYLLYAYLLDNPRARVLFGSYYHSKTGKQALDAFMRGRWPSGGASLWFSLDGRSRAKKRT